MHVYTFIRRIIQGEDIERLRSPRLSLYFDPSDSYVYIVQSKHYDSMALSSRLPPNLISLSSFVAKLLNKSGADVSATSQAGRYFLYML
jgi:hypothetical protein